MPRRPDPRARVPAGSVGIGGTQTGVYSVECPSGWHLLDRTPLRVFDPNRREPFPLAPGDRVRFRPVSPDAWDALVHRARDGDLAPEREEVLA
jgi:allophanate hydrolase subunit 1